MKPMKSMKSMKSNRTQETFRITETNPSQDLRLENFINLFVPEVRPIIETALKSSIDLGTPYDLELPVITSNGRSIWVRTQGFAERKERKERKDGKVVKIYGALKDITKKQDIELALLDLNSKLEISRQAEADQAKARAAAEEALKHAQEEVQEAKKAQEALDQYATQRTSELSAAVVEMQSFNQVVSHHLRGPLHGLASLSGLILGELDRGDPAHQTQKWLSMMERQTRRLAQLVDDLTTLMHASTKKREIEIIDLGELAKKALHLLESNFDRYRLTKVSIESLPTLHVEGALMEQVFVNLLSNSLKFTRESESPHIEVFCERLGADWVVAVRDNGIGFDQAQSEEIFKPFVRLHEASFEGSGMGLTLVQRIVERHGGQVWAEGGAKTGATIRFSLPDRLPEAT